MKKVLSFVLSVAMVICLMPVMAFAADEANATGTSQFSDWDSVNNKEAVAVLVGLGVIDGMGDGTFQPQGDLTRAQASKLVATIVKSGDKSDIPAPAADPFTDVQKSHWAAGSVKFGVDNGYINGMGDGTFHPDDQVTTAQMATMLEKLLGYTSEDVNYNWPDNAMAYAAAIELLENISKGPGEVLNREEAAQMIFNALKEDVVIKQTVAGSVIVNYNPVANSKSDYADRPDDRKLQLVEKYFPKATYIPETFDAFGHESVAWMNGRTKITDEVISNPSYVYTAKMTAKDLKADLDGYKFTLTDGALFNGDDIDAPTDLKSFAEITGNGKAVELYTNAKDTEITKIIASDYEPVAVTKVDAKSQTVTLDNGTVVNSDDDAYEVLSSLKAGAKVLAAINEKGEVLDAYVPTEVTGAVTKITTKGVVTVGGTDYEKAATAKDVFKVNASDNGTTYLDEYGYAEDYASEKAAELDVADWLLVKDVYSITSTSEADKYAEGSTTTTKYYVLGVTEAGEVVDLELNTANGEDKGATEATQATFDWASAALEGVNPVPSANNSQVQAKFYAAGEVVTYVETANGYTIASTDPSNKSKSAKTEAKVAANAKTIGSNYVSTDVKTIKVTGKKASEVAATVEDGLAAVPKDTPYIIKKSGKNELVATVFTEEEAKEAETPVAIIKVVEKTADVTYTDKNGKAQTGSTVSYYDEESADPKDMTVTNTTVKAGGWYTAKEVVENVYELTEYKSGSEKVLIATGTIDEAYNGSATIDGVVYNIEGEAAVRDLRQDGTAETVDDLAPNMTVEIAYTTDSKTKVNTVTQIYITGVEAATPEGEEAAAN